MKKQLLLLVMMLLPMMAMADAVEIDGIYYNLIPKGKVAEVTSNPNKYSGIVVIPDNVEYEGTEYSVTSIVNRAFYGCSSLTSVTIPNSVTSIGDDAFWGCTGLKKVIVKDIAAWCGISFSGETSNPLYYAHHLYNDENTEITELIIPNSVTSIGNYAFQNCSCLTSVTISNSVTSIGDRAFYGCSGLTSVTIPNSVTSIGNGAFYGCSGLTSVTIPNSVTSIGNSAFNRCSGLTSITIPNSVTSIGNYAFQKCSGLTSVTIPNSVTSIGDRAFEYCSGLTSITIPNSVTNIGSGAFQYCSGLKKVIVQDIAAWCGISFGGYYSNPLYYAHHLYNDENTEITELIIPNSVTSIGNYAFQNCSCLTSVTIPNSVTSISYYAFEGCSGLTSVTIPNSVTIIGEWTFRNCSGLTSVTIPNSVWSIGQQAFESCSGLTSVNIGSGVKTIGGQAFASCAELTDVYCYAENVPSTNTNAFEGSYTEYATLHVPTASIEAYKSKAPWSSFGTIASVDGTLPDPPETPKCATPTISFANGELEFSCETEGVEFVSEVTVGDAKKNYSSKVSLTGVYQVSVYATKAGYDNSDIATKEINVSSTGIKGDVTGDGEVTITDAVEVVNIIMGKDE